jgi:hypothetical protein
MMQQLFDRWTEIQKQYGATNPIGGQIQDRLSDELNVLEALRLVGCTRIPGEAADVQSLINDRHQKLQEIVARLKHKG